MLFPLEPSLISLSTGITELGSIKLMDLQIPFNFGQTICTWILDHAPIRISDGLAFKRYAYQLSCKKR